MARDPTDMNRKGNTGESNLLCTGQRDNICILSVLACVKLVMISDMDDNCINPATNSSWP